ncbi:uncharacterized protein GJ701_016722 isoform 2-T3 [Geothlypis trichas]
MADGARMLPTAVLSVAGGARFPSSSSLCVSSIGDGRAAVAMGALVERTAGSRVGRGTIAAGASKSRWRRWRSCGCGGALGGRRQVAVGQSCARPCGGQRGNRRRAALRCAALRWAECSRCRSAGEAVEPEVVPVLSWFVEKRPVWIMATCGNGRAHKSEVTN